MDIEIFSKEGKYQDFIEFTFPAASPKMAPRALLSLKSAGDMKYNPQDESPARLAFFRRLGIDPERVVGIELKHSRNVAFINTKEDLRALVDAQHESEGFDGIITTNRMLVPSVTVADCMPIYLFCEKAGAFGVLHSGWKGTGILSVALEGMMERFPCSPCDISVIFGPAIGVCCYEVDSERAARFRNEFGLRSVREMAKEDGTIRYYIDLLGANIELAQSLGIKRCTAVRACTSCGQRFASYRRDGAQHFTRMLALTLSPFPH